MRLPNGRLGAEESAVLLFLRGEGRRLLRGEAAVATVGAATRFSGAEAQVAAPDSTRVHPHAPLTSVGALLWGFVCGAGATGRSGGEREDNGDDTHREACVVMRSRLSPRSGGVRARNSSVFPKLPEPQFPLIWGVFSTRGCRGARRTTVRCTRMRGGGGWLLPSYLGCGEGLQFESASGL